MTRFEKIKTDLTVEKYADQNRFALKCNNCRKHQPGVFGACTFADCRKETIRYLNEEVEMGGERMNEQNKYCCSCSNHSPTEGCLLGIIHDGYDEDCHAFVFYYPQPTEPTTTHGTMLEASDELELIDRSIINVRDKMKGWTFGGDSFEMLVATQDYITALLKSRRDALISQRVIR